MFPQTMSSTILTTHTASPVIVTDPMRSRRTACINNQSPRQKTYDTHTSYLHMMNDVRSSSRGSQVYQICQDEGKAAAMGGIKLGRSWILFHLYMCASGINRRAWKSWEGHRVTQKHPNNSPKPTKEKAVCPRTAIE